MTDDDDTTRKNKNKPQQPNKAHEHTTNKANIIWQPTMAKPSKEKDKEKEKQGEDQDKNKGGETESDDEPTGRWYLFLEKQHNLIYYYTYYSIK